MTDNLRNILGIELLSAAQGLEFRKPLKTSSNLNKVLTGLRKSISHLEEDRSLSPDIEKAAQLIQNGILIQAASDVHFPNLASR